MAEPTPPPSGSVGVGPDAGRGEVTGAAGGVPRRVQRTINFDRGVLERARAAATYLATREPGAGVRSLADIVNLAVAQRVAELEERYNDGKPFRPVYRMPPGRPSRN
ncbi:hypothetical protein LX15_003396 [Streptoalloteichus tenebrarius]|uniref:Centromere-binding protein ParB C-terminal domain-containing protein n=1 Tax=Streptoalloteichus tenebrarius (strain ATCC 17920 / DSM 40477 / JCM 4838 / CBS 697.72 / NBRC 16177 / NCIMB 11028 / NRRL B-12390 / A12253. 1 / ISP 5477) TaxID=1933 RepID=A0ABT1HVZ3_STRSD|nr:hypothetical protein [Streptoalloteichus tenebrarius]MCP2259690.1 hypothetical protein [Streptoalloteichus tenebrarius]BFF00667.1 hypothetical protein GCM10020241_23420 [Streptoalloteichus tenebrarius]